MTRRRIGLLAAALLLTSGAPAANAQDDASPDVVDPLSGGQQVSRSDIAGSVRVLQPKVRRLQPRVRELKTEQRQQDRVTVTISSDVLFAFDSAELSAQAKKVIEDLATRIARTPPGPVQVVGHTDSIGTRAYNQDLSERRAASVAAVLKVRLGGGRTIAAEGRNFSQPVAPEQVGGRDNARGRALNRRVTISFAEPA